ncbi:hypothetical protein C2845_PM18G03900 [Panicum miliaceum]|uniref:KIB1-4 beta-propeller domain-containing protein n=1 Tax=Panicum miliaceum TaxID=4540 RepID=A0A3L6PHE3_PANMI|nr:hypothetical protein C2845_PM18G03900 [Panicum miliaceum]
MAAPPPAPRSWADLAADHLYEVLARVPCLPPPLPRALPWLLLPAPYHDGATRAACCVLSGCRVHHHLAVTPPGARCFGSHDGAWLFLHFRDTASHQLLNVRTGDVHHCLPGVLGNKLVVLAAALSSPPREGDARCVAAAIVATVEAPRQRSVLLWRVGPQRLHEAVQSVGVGVGLGVDVEDVVYHRRAFHLLTRGGHIVISGDKAHTDVDDDDADADNAEDGGNFVVQYHWSSWSELDTLGGRMLFVGHGCSRSYEVDQYPGFKDGIYFLDDGDFYDAAVIFGNGNVRQYPCSDNGRWSEGHVQRCFPRSDSSDHSAPVWLLP